MVCSSALTGPATVTFVGEVPAGSLSNPIPKGFSIKASQVPQAGKASTDLSFQRPLVTRSLFSILPETSTQQALLMNSRVIGMLNPFFRLVRPFSFARMLRRIGPAALTSASNS
jgi:hypothetical protein